MTVMLHLRGESPRIVTFPPETTLAEMITYLEEWRVGHAQIARLEIIEPVPPSDQLIP